MRDLVSPKQVARAIGVSESSLKRWCDQGVVRSVRTAGGHRRIRVADVVKYLRDQGQRLTQPELLGLPPVTSGAGTRSISKAREELIQSLIRGEESLARQIAFDLYLSRHRMSVICDDVLAPAFHEIGRRWGCGDIAIYQERRSCEIALRLVQELRSMLPDPVAGASRAIGATLLDDHYVLPTVFVELVLLECGWNATSLGNGLPVETLLQAVVDLDPDLFWLSISYVADGTRLRDDLLQLNHLLGERQTLFVVGGQKCPDVADLPRLRVISSLRELEAFVPSQTVTDSDGSQASE